MLCCGIQRYYAGIRTFGKLVVLCALSKLPTNILLELNNYSNNIRKTKLLTVGETLIRPFFEALDKYAILRMTVINKPCRSCTSRKHVQSNMNSPVCCWEVLFCNWQAEIKNIDIALRLLHVIATKYSLQIVYRLQIHLKRLCSLYAEVSA